MVLMGKYKSLKKIVQNLETIPEELGTKYKRFVKIIKDNFWEESVYGMSLKKSADRTFKFSNEDDEWIDIGYGHHQYRRRY